MDLPVVQTMHRLSPMAYAELEKAVGQEPFVQASTTELQAGFMLGGQFVLKKLRTGFVVGA